ncbi:MAG TPA: hypothetical protein VF838_03755 [Trebonia sp.]
MAGAQAAGAQAAGAQAAGAREAGERVEALLAELRARSGPEAADVAEELVSCLVRFYGAGLAAIMRTIGDDQRLRALLIADPLVESLLLVHDLHPLDAGTRVRRALGRLGTGAEFLGIDEAGVVHVRLGHGCGSTTEAVEQVVGDAAPDTAGVEFAPREAPLLQITRRPAGAI